MFRWTQLLDIPAWIEVQKSFQYLLKNKKLNQDCIVDEDRLLDEYNHVVHMIQVKIVEWKKMFEKCHRKMVRCI